MRKHQNELDDFRVRYERQDLASTTEDAQRMEEEPPGSSQSLGLEVGASAGQGLSPRRSFRSARKPL